MSTFRLNIHGQHLLFLDEQHFNALTDAVIHFQNRGFRDGETVNSLVRITECAEPAQPAKEK